MNELAKYTGLPYDFRLHNCWHHVRRVRADFGLNTPTFDCTSPAEIDATFEDGRQNSKGLVQITEPQPYCAVLMASNHLGRTVWHSGVYLNGMVSHCDRVARQVRLDSLKSLQEQCARVEFWQ